MPYAIDLSQLPLAAYLAVLKAQTLLPSRRPLITDIDARFAAIARHDVRTLAQLRQRLATPAKLAAFAQASSIDGAWLTLLRREMGTLDVKPLPLAGFAWVGTDVLASLAAEGIHTTRDYFESAHFGTGELSALCELTRINGIGPAAARAFYGAGFATANAVASASAADLLVRVTAHNEAHGYYRAKLGLKDMKFCIDYARLLAACGA